MEPITDIEALRPLTGLKILNLNYNQKLKDISAIADMPDLEELQIAATAITSLKGIEGHKRLRCLNLNNLKLKDLSPLAECDYAWAEACGGMNLSITNDKVTDWSFLSRIPRYDWMGMGGISPDKWLDAVSGSQVRGIYCGSFNQAQLETLLDQHPELEDLHIPNCTKVTDISRLPGMQNLRFVKVSKNMNKAVKSLEGAEYSFQLEIE
jgi:hypothetical protein